MNEGHARGLGKRDTSAHGHVLAVAMIVTLGAGFTALVRGQSGASERLTFSETPRVITRPSGQPAAAGKSGQAPPSTVLALAVSPDGHTIALAGEDPAIALRDASTNQARGVLSGHTDSVACLTFSPDGKILASSGLDRKVRLWDMTAKAGRSALPEQPGWVLALAFSPDGKTLACGGQDRTVTLWDVAGARKVATLTGHAGTIRALAFSPDGLTLVSAGDDQVVRLWDARTRAVKASWAGHQGTIRALAFRPDGRSLATASEDHTVRLWDVATGRATTTHKESSEMLLALAFSPSGNALVAGGYDGKVRIWSPPDSTAVSVLRGHQEGVTALAFNPRTSDLVTAGYDRAVKVWSPGVQVATLKKTLPNSPTGNVQGLALFSPDDKSLMTAELTSTAAEGVVRIWDTSTWRERGALRHDDGTHVFGRFTTDGRVIVTASPGSVRTWDAQRLTPIASLVSRASAVQRFLTFAVAPDGSALAYVDPRGAVVIRDLPAPGEAEAAVGRAEIEPRFQRTLIEPERGLIVNQLEFAPDSKSIVAILASFSELHTTFTLRDVADGHELVNKHVQGREFARVFFAPDRKTAVGVFSNQTVEGDTSLFFWSTSTWQEVGRMTAASSAPTTFTYSPDGSFFALASRTGVVSFWESKTRQPLGQFTAHDGLIVSVVFTADGRTLATASTTPGQPVKIWDVAATLAPRPQSKP